MRICKYFYPYIMLEETKFYVFMSEYVNIYEMYKHFYLTIIIDLNCSLNCSALA